MTGNKTAVVAHWQISEGRGNTKPCYFILWEQIQRFSFGSYVEETVVVLPVIKYVYSRKRKNNHRLNLWFYWKKESNQNPINYQKKIKNKKQSSFCADCGKLENSRY